MPVFRSPEVRIAVTGIAAVVALSTAVAIVSPPASTGLVPGSSLSKGPEGSAAAYMTLEALGYPIRRSLDGIASLTAPPASTVLILANPIRPASEGDRRALRAFVAAGGTVLATGCVAPLFLGAPSAQFGGPGQPERPVSAPPDPAAKAQPYEAALPSPLAAGAPTISMRVECPGTGPEAPFTTLYGDDRTPAVRVARIGSGLAVWWAGHTPIANSAIDQPGHLELLLNIVGPTDRAIVWDEFYHGQQRSLYSYARLTPLPWLLAQAALVALVAAAMYVRRRAPIMQRTVEPRVAPLEFVDTIAALYARAGTAADAVATAQARLRRLLLEGTALPASIDRAALVASGASRAGLDAQEVGAALREADRYTAGHDASAQEVLPLVRRLQAIAARLDRKGA